VRQTARQLQIGGLERFKPLAFKAKENVPFKRETAASRTLEKTTVCETVKFAALQSPYPDANRHCWRVLDMTTATVMLSGDEN
jgi:hypothetical protein